MEKKLCRPPPLPWAGCERPSRMHSKPRRYPLPKPWQKYPREPSARTPARAWLLDFDFDFYCRFVFFFCRVRASGARGTAPARRGEGEQVPSSGVSSSARGGWGRLSARSARGGRARFPGARGAGARASAAAAWAAAGAATAGKSSNGQARVRTSEAEYGHVRTRLASATCRRGITRADARQGCRRELTHACWRTSSN